jgi:hypothetical protein
MNLGQLLIYTGSVKGGPLAHEPYRVAPERPLRLLAIAVVNNSAALAGDCDKRDSPHRTLFPRLRLIPRMPLWLKIALLLGLLLLCTGSHSMPPLCLATHTALASPKAARAYLPLEQLAPSHRVNCIRASWFLRWRPACSSGWLDFSEHAGGFGRVRRQTALGVVTRVGLAHMRMQPAHAPVSHQPAPSPSMGRTSRTGRRASDCLPGGARSGLAAARAGASGAGQPA